MDLLTPENVQNASAAEQSRSILRSQGLAEAEKELRIRLAKAEQEFNGTLVKNRKKWEEEEASHSQRIGEMRKEIEHMEAEKLKLIVPFDILKEGADGRFRDADEFLNNLRKREERTEELTELLEDKLDGVGEREESVKHFEESLFLRQTGIDSQAESLKNSSLTLTKDMKDFYASRDKLLGSIKDKQNELLMKESTLVATEDSQKEKEKELKQREVRLSDERGVLERAWAEFRRMQ